MSQLLLFALLGLGSGAIIATVALGLVVMHRASGVINFAHGALAMYAIYVYISLRDEGRLLLPVPAAPAINLDGAMPVVPAFALAVISTAVLGALAYLLVFRQLERAPVLAQIVATVGLLLAISGLVELHFSSQSASPFYVPNILPTGRVFSIGHVEIQADLLWLTALALAAAGILHVLYRHTTFGLATRAVAASGKGAVLIGRDPQLIALGNWVLASVLAGIFGVLVAPLISIDPQSIVLLVVPSLAAAMVAGMTSFWWACIAGLILGMTESELVNLQTNHPSLPEGLQVVAPLLVIIVVAFLRGHSTVRRSDLAQDRLPTSPTPRRVAQTSAAGFVVGMAALALTTGDIRLGVITSLVSAVICLSMVVVTGYLGQVSLMQLTLAGLSGLLLTALAAGAGIPFPLAPLIAVVGATGLGLLLGVPALRVRGTSLAIVTLAAAVATQELIFPLSILSGGAKGDTVTAPKILGVNFSILSGSYPGFAFGIFTLVIAVVVAIAVANLRRSPSGVRMLSVRANERAASSAGINVAQTKLVGFTLAAAVAGAGGALFAYQQVQFNTEYFGVSTSLLFLAFAYLGGITSVAGAVIAGALIPGGVVLTLLGNSSTTAQYESLAAGVLVMAIAMLRPDGLAGLVPRMPWWHRRPSCAVKTAAQDDHRRPERSLQASGRQSDATRPTTVLEVSDVSIQYGNLRAVDHVSFAVAEGTILGIIGPNGAGKTSLIDGLSGFAPLAGGGVRLNGRDIGELQPHVRARLGLSRTWQSGELFEDLTVRENVLVAADAPHWWSIAADVVRPNRRVAKDAHARRVMDLLDLADVADRFVSEVPQDKRKLVSIARSLAGEPRVVLMDEPAAGLNTDETVALGRRLRQVAAEGIAIVLIEHDMEMVFTVCDEVVVLDFGRPIAQGTPSEIANDTRVIEAYLGATTTAESLSTETEVV